MRIAIGADHAGFALKQQLRDHLAAAGHDVADHGTHTETSCDYPDLAASVAHAVASGAADRGILVCGSGVGMCIAANKVAGIRAALAVDDEGVRLTRGHNDSNVLTMGQRTLDAATAARLVDIFLTTPFDAGRHLPRLEKIRALEQAASTKSKESQ